MSSLLLQILPLQYHSKAFCFFHQINAFEDQGCIVLDLCCFDDGETFDIYRLQNLHKAGEALDQVPLLCPPQGSFILQTSLVSPRGVGRWCSSPRQGWDYKVKESEVLFLLGPSCSSSLWQDQRVWISFSVKWLFFWLSWQTYNMLSRPFPRRFVLPITVSSKASVGQNVNPLSYTLAEAVKEADGKVGNLYQCPCNLERMKAFCFSCHPLEISPSCKRQLDLGKNSGSYINGTIFSQRLTKLSYGELGSKVS